MVTAAMKLKDACSLEGESYDQPRQHIKKQRYYFELMLLNCGVGEDS